MIIHDTKWKLINENMAGQKYKINEVDFYQMLAYNQTYQKDQNRGEAKIWLTYPRSEKFTQVLPDFKFENGLTIKVLPFDIDSSFLLLEQ